MAPSLRNLLKCLFIDKGIISYEDTADDLRNKMKEKFAS